MVSGRREHQQRLAARADALHARLVPPGLDPDPLTTIENLVAARKAADGAAAHLGDGSANEGNER